MVKRVGILLALASLSLGATCNTALEVDRFDDVPSARACTSAPNDCSLRGAILAANAQIGGRVQIKVPAGTFLLTVAGTNEDAGQRGDLDLSNAIQIDIGGAGVGATIIDAGGLDRVFDFGPALPGVPVASLRDVTVRGGVTTSSAADGAGIRNKGGLLLLRVEVVDNHAVGGASGGGIASYGALRLVSSSVTGNTADQGYGGGVTNGNVATNSGGFTTIVQNSTISGNTAHIGGGGIASAAGGTLTLSGSTISGNSADSSLSATGASMGGGIASLGTLDATNSTITANLAHGSGVDAESGASIGGGIYGGLGSAVTLTNVTLAGNLLDGSFVDGTGIAAAGTVVLANTLIANACTALGGAGVYTSNGGNLESPNDTCFLTQPTDFPATEDPGLDVLAPNGGVTETMALLEGGAAIDAGDPQVTCPATDQRGYLRLDGFCDIGAFEFGALPPPPPTPTPTPTP